MVVLIVGFILESRAPECVDFFNSFGCAMMSGRDVLAIPAQESTSCAIIFDSEV